VCVCERERRDKERVCVCMREGGRERGRERVCV
jgi:hypothetical protein